MEKRKGNAASKEQKRFSQRHIIPNNIVVVFVENRFYQLSDILLMLSLALFTLAGAKRPDVIRFSLAMTMPSLAKRPTQVPALLIASIAYSTYTM
jgi:hypothetical protein